MCSIVLQVKVCQPYFKNMLLSDLSVNRYPIKTRFFYYLALPKLRHAESALICVRQDKLTPKKFHYIFFALTSAFVLILFALDEIEDKRTCDARVVITLDSQCCLFVKALQLLSVVMKVICRIFVAWIKETTVFLIFEHLFCARNSFKFFPKDTRRPKAPSLEVCF